jgi:hypothetical protein
MWRQLPSRRRVSTKPTIPRSLDLYPHPAPILAKPIRGKRGPKCSGYVKAWDKDVRDAGWGKTHDDHQ